MLSAADGDGRIFFPAKVFRRTGEKSFAVQLMGPGGMYFPGVIEVYCLNVDWSNHPMLGSREQEASDGKARSGGWMLSERLRTMGTPEMFSRMQPRESTTGHGTGPADASNHAHRHEQQQQQQQWNGHMCTSEGVEICLGPYEPCRHAFIRCELRVVAPSPAPN